MINKAKEWNLALWDKLGNRPVVEEQKSPRRSEKKAEKNKTSTKDTNKSLQQKF